MKYKLRLVHLQNGNCRIQKKHWFLTFGFWVTLHNEWTMEYYEDSEKRCRDYIRDYYDRFEDRRIKKYEEV